MKAPEMLRMAYVCGLTTLEEAHLNITRHSMLLFKYDDICYFHYKINENIDEQISKYLTSIEYLHNGSKTWDEIFSMVNLVKATRDIMSSFNEVKANNSNKFLSKFNRLK